MTKKTLYAKAIVNIVIYLLSIAIAVVFLPKLLAFFLPFVIGWIISCIANPVVRFFERKIRFKRKAMSAIMLVLIIGIIILAGYGIIAFLVDQGMGFVASIPSIWENLEVNIAKFERSTTNLISGLPLDIQNYMFNIGNKLEGAMDNFVGNLSSGSDISNKLVAWLSSGIGGVASAIIGTIMCLLSAFLFTAEHDSLLDKLEKLLPHATYKKIDAAVRGLKKAVGGYIVAQIKIEVWIYLITCIGLLILKVNYAVIIALGVAVLDFLPFFGAGAVMVPWGIVSIINENYYLGIGLLITWGVGQLVRQLIQPKIVGDEIGFAPLPTLFVLFLGYKFGGMFGMIIAVPVAMIAVSLYEENVFSTFVDSVKIIWTGIADFRKLPTRPWDSNQR